MRIAHVSDLHVLSRTAAQWRSIIFNKRLTGFANLILRRGRVHRRQFLLAVLAAAAEQADHLVVTGDITNLSLEHEYEEACRLLADVAHRTEVTVVPGNHDSYLSSIHGGRRFPHHFERFIRSDLPSLARNLAAGPFPSVKLRDRVAIIGLSSAVPQSPLRAAGCVGRPQLDALEELLAHSAVRSRTAVVLIHHPPADSRPRLVQLRDGLVDGAALRTILRRLSHGVVLFGHLHARGRCQLRTEGGGLDVIGASGAALDHPDITVRAGFNVYDLDAAGKVSSAEAHVVNAHGTGFETIPISEGAWCG
jgi:3',5'-cyclic AMP phosphodiesterase CpdA